MKRIIGKINPEDRNVAIWGAGFSGLILGYYLKEQGYRVTIYEKSNRVGGKIQTKKTGAGLAEKAANALFLNQDGLDLLKELKLEPIPVTKKLRRLLMINGKPKRPYQLSVLSRVAVNVYKKPPLIFDGLTVSDFFRPLLGENVVHDYLSPVLGGLYATGAEELHFKSLFPQVGNKAQFDSYWAFIKHLIKERKSGPKLDLSGSVSFEGGMQTLINRLAEVLKSEIKLNYKEHFRLKGNTIICTDALSAADLLSELRPQLSAELARVKYRPLSSSTVFLKRELKGLQKAFGVLIPQRGNYHSIGILNNKAIFPANNENVSSYTFISPKHITKDEILEDLRHMSPEVTVDDLEHIETTYWERALPVYDLQLYLAVKKLHQMAIKESNLAIFGNYVAGISLRDMISAAKNFAKAPLEYPENRA